MENTCLRFNHSLYSDKEIEKFVSDFQEKGYVVLPKIFERESVSDFRSELENIMEFNGVSYFIPDDSPHYLEAAFAPRGRQVLPYALSHSFAKPMPVIHTTIVVIETDETRGKYAPEWHKDRAPDGMPGSEYHYPLDVFLAFYFEDIDDEHGPTKIIPGSHRDLTLLPNTGQKEECIHLKMEDALLIDQRAWHRGVPRQAPGTRFVMVYGMYALPHHYGTTFIMPAIQRKKWMQAQNLKDRVFLGGPFAPPSNEELEEMKIENNKVKNLFQNQFPRML